MQPELADGLGEALAVWRKTRADELSVLADLLVKENLVSDPGPLIAAASEAQGPLRRTREDHPDPGRWYWGLVVDGLQLTLEQGWKGVPRDSLFETSSLTITFHEYVPDDAASLAEVYANLRLSDVAFTLAGYCEHQDGIKPIHGAWHLDTHLYPEATAVAHPKHHFQFGGNDLEVVNDDIRALWIPDTPRLATLPLDPILAVDFVLSHYAGPGWARLQLQDEYLALRRAAASRYWRPCLQTLVGFFDADEKTADQHPALKLLPNLAWR